MRPWMYIIIVSDIAIFVLKRDVKLQPTMYIIKMQNKTEVLCFCNLKKTRMWANAQRDGRPVEYRWRPLFNAAKFG